MVYKLTVIIFIAALFFSNADAQSNKFALKNQIEFGGSFSFSVTTPVMSDNTGNSNSEISFYPSFGWFPVNGLELGALIELKYEKPGDGQSSTDYAFYFAPSYNINTKSIVYPYLQGQIGYSGLSGSSDASGIAWGFEGGAKIQVLSRALVKAGLNYKQVTRNPDGSESRNGYNEVAFLAGFMLFFNL
jgi:hypothetical protein